MHFKRHLSNPDMYIVHYTLLRNNISECFIAVRIRFMVLSHEEPVSCLTRYYFTNVRKILWTRVGEVDITNYHNTFQKVFSGITRKQYYRHARN